MTRTDGRTHLPRLAGSDTERTPRPLGQTIKADAAKRTFGSLGAGVVWGVLDSGVDADHPHFAASNTLTSAAVANLHRDFTLSSSPRPRRSALTDPYGHGTHVAAIIAGQAPQDNQARRIARSAGGIRRPACSPRTANRPPTVFTVGAEWVMTATSRARRPRRSRWGQRRMPRMSFRRESFTAWTRIPSFARTDLHSAARTATSAIRKCFGRSLPRLGSPVRPMRNERDVDSRATLRSCRGREQVLHYACGLRSAALPSSSSTTSA